MKHFDYNPHPEDSTSIKWTHIKEYGAE
ncbi:LOW QUALITY PROTEIN: hypothetical protein TorRG33x02_298250 [Trema orientale]|uniref:Uncharacterized protein n=1 Tax=Trema orientale TaxID=63057 RepID=A0A2P5C4C6_TREOI|nr:LOW QUALITY PROTEIN: hypothetical protein TorRG33x02_298250 [Trema orientale]